MKKAGKGMVSFFVCFRERDRASTYLVHGIHDPIDARIAADGLVLGVDEDDLKVLVCRILVDPVRVEDAQVGAAAADALFGGGFEGPLVLQLVDSLVCGFACDDDAGKK